jgi:aspartyl aminopeptidase
LNRETNEKFSPNKETHLVPILATTVQEKLLKAVPEKMETTEVENPVKLQSDKHQPLLVELVCKELACKPDEIVDLELSLCDTQPAVLGGVFEEFIFGGRLDNQVGAYCSIKAIIEASNYISDETGMIY